MMSIIYHRSASTANAALRDKVVVVAGGSTGIDLGIANGSAAEGAQVDVTSRRQAELDATMVEIGSRAAAGEYS